MPTHHDTPVLIAGAGPVGLILAADLAWRGIACTIVDPKTEVIEHPRAISIGVRTMEHFRRLGLDQQVIDAGVPRDQALDVIFVTRMLGKEIFRFAIPSINDLATHADALANSIPETTASPYYKTWTAQTPLERVLRRHVMAQKEVELRTGWRLTKFEQNPTGVSAHLREESTGREETIATAFLIGCDGAKSDVRSQLSIAMSGRGTLGTAMGFYFRAPQLRARLGQNAGVMYWMLAPDTGGTIYTINGGDEWVYNRYFNTLEEAQGLNPLTAIHAAIGEPLDVEILSVLEWEPRQLVATSYGSERVFLAGDACHQFVPTGGLGMNTGIGDAVDLAWKIQAALAGWGGSNLLRTYDSERRPIGEQNTLEAADNYYRSREIQAYPPGLEDDTTEGEAVRMSIAAQLPPKIKHFAPIGVHLGYRYEGSPLIVSDGSPEPPREAASYTPCARPGHRAPHAWLSPGHSTLDLFGKGFTLLCGSKDAEAAGALLAVAKATGTPMQIEVCASEAVSRLYGATCVLVRPDGHVCWRGDTPPEHPEHVLDIVTGRQIT